MRARLFWLATLVSFYHPLFGADAPLLSSAPVVAASPTAIHLLTLPDSLRLALEHATTVLKAKNNVELSGAELWQAYSQFLPNVAAEANYGWTKGRILYTNTVPTTVDTTYRSAGYQVSSTLNLFSGFLDYGGLKGSRARRLNADFTYYRARQQIILDVTQAYLQVLLDRQLIHIGEANLKASQEREHLLSEQSRVGIRSLADLYRQQAQTSSDALFLINARNQARNDLIALLRRLRVDLTQHYDLADVVLDTPPAIDPYANEQELMQRAVAHRTDLAASHAAVQATQWDVVTARSGYFPRLDLMGSVDGSGRILKRQIVSGVDALPTSQDSLGHQLGDQVVYNAGLNLSWGLFDRYLTHLTVVRAQVAAKNTQLDDEDLLLVVEGDVQQVSGDYHSALEQLNVAAVGVRAAQESMDAVNARYDVGASNIVDLLTAQSALVQAQAADAQARIGYMLENKTIENVLGETKIP